MSEFRRISTSSFARHLSRLKSEEFALFKKKLSALRVTPNLKSDIDRVCAEAVRAERRASLAMTPSASPGAPGADDFDGVDVVPSATPPLDSLRRACDDDFREMVADFAGTKMAAAKASGAFVPFPRRGVALGIHWLLPKPFADEMKDERQRQSSFDPEKFIYTPKGKSVEVDKREVLGRQDWMSRLTERPAKEKRGLLWNVDE